jgi:hypothetical protein
VNDVAVHGTTLSPRDRLMKCSLCKSVVVAADFADHVHYHEAVAYAAMPEQG